MSSVTKAAMDAESPLYLRQLLETQSQADAMAIANGV